MTTWGELLNMLNKVVDERQQAKQKRQRQTLREIQEPFIPWPEVHKRLRVSPEVYARIRKYNPDHRGVKAGQRLRGLHVKPNLKSAAFQYNGITVSAFIERYGRQAYYALPNDAYIRAGKRKLIAVQYIAANFGGLK